MMSCPRRHPASAASATAIASALFAVVCLLLAAAPQANACIYEFGTIDEAIALAGSHYTYSYNGLDWPNSFSGCRGKRQSPLLLPASGAAAKALGQPDAKSTFSYGKLSNAKIVNNGHTLQVSLPANFTSDVKIPVKGATANASATSVLSGSGDVSYVKASPAQFHFHSRSEHVISGAEYPLEMHIVHFIKSDQLPACGEKGCPAVLGIMLALTDNEAEVQPELRRVIEAMPLNEGGSAVIAGELDLNTLLPADRSYFTYEGSLTTPPCTEGILWHVLATPIKISTRLLTKYKEAVGDLYCPEKSDKDDDKDKKESGGKPDTTLPANGTFFALPSAGKDGCVKLANGHNYRAIQPVNDRPIKLAT